MADISTAVSMARVPILGEDGRISDDYIPAAIGEGVESAEAAATRAEAAATDAEGSASAARQSATQAASSASAAGASASQAQESAATAGGAATQAQSAQKAAEAAKTGAESAQSAAAGSAQDAQQSATAAAQSAASVADKFISSAQATTLEPGSQATASVENQVLTIGVPKGDKGDKGDTGDTGKQGVQGDKGDPGTAATIAVGSVTGLAAGASPTVVNSGTANAAVLDFGIPKGDKGDKGDTGIGVPEGGEPGQLLSKTDSGTAWVDPPSGNVLTGTSTGYVAHAEDAYAQKPIEVRVKGKTWVNRWPVLSGSNNGITVATDGTGLVTVTGTATADADIVADVSGWATGKSYTATISVNPTGCNAYFEVRKPSGNTSINATTAGATLNVASDATNCVAGVHVASGTTVNASFRVMLVDGTEAPDCFTPCASIASVKTGSLVTAGKNLLPPVSEWDTSDQYYNRYIVNPFPIGTQLVGRYGGNPSGLVSNVRLEFRENYDSDDYSKEITPWNDTSVVGRAVTVTARDRYISIVTAESADAYFDQMQFQLELGSTATAYEPPAVTATPLPEVELRSLPNGTCDELVIKADGSCVVERNVTEYEVQGTETLLVGEHSNGQKYALIDNIASSFSSSSSMLSDRYACGEYGLTDMYAYVPNAMDLVINDNRFTDVETAKSILASEKPRFVFPVNSTTEPQSPVTLPVLPAPTFNQYHDSPIPSDTSTQYVRDINIVLDNLAKQVAGTASAVAVREASTIEEE